MASRIAWPPAVRDVCRRQIDQKQPAIGIDGNVTLAADDLLGRALTDWLGITAAERLASRPARSRSTISAMSWSGLSNRRRTKRRNHQYTVCQGGKSLGSISQPQPVRTR